MIFELHYGRVEICAAMEIVDSTFRMHIAAIKRKQAVFRRIRAEEQIKRDQERTNEKFLPEMESPDFPVDIEKRSPTITFEHAGTKKGTMTRTAHNHLPLKELVSLEPHAAPPIPLKPSMPDRTSPSVFVEVERTQQKTRDGSLFRVQFSNP